MSRCWAHNIDMVRCDLDAGHDGDHTVHITWPDEDCYEPGKSPAAAPIVIPPTAPPPPPPANDKCVACQHKHRGRECHGACECKEFIG